MRVLIVKTSSMGDVIHTLPALTDASRVYPHILFDWVVEENFQEIPRWHPQVNLVIPIAWRRWRKNVFAKKTWQQMQMFRKKIQAERYDYIIDAQGLLKSAFFSLFALGPRVGFNALSARESLATLFYDKKCLVASDVHAITRVRDLFSQVLDYQLPTTTPEYGIDRKTLLVDGQQQDPYIVFLHGTTWLTKHWPEHYWQDLAVFANNAGFAVKLPWGNSAELERAKRIAAHVRYAEVLPKLDLAGVARVLAGAKAIAAVDTGLGHLAAALNVPTVSLYGPTDPILTGAQGESQVTIAMCFPCAPCFSKECHFRGEVTEAVPPLHPQCFSALPASRVWQALAGLV